MRPRRKNTTGEISDILGDGIFINIDNEVESDYSDQVLMDSENDTDIMEDFPLKSYNLPIGIEPNRVISPEKYVSLKFILFSIETINSLTGSLYLFVQELIHYLNSENSTEFIFLLKSLRDIWENNVGIKSKNSIKSKIFRGNGSDLGGTSERVPAIVGRINKDFDRILGDINMWQAGIDTLSFLLDKYSFKSFEFNPDDLKSIIAAGTNFDVLKRKLRGSHPFLGTQDAQFITTITVVMEELEALCNEEEKRILEGLRDGIQVLDFSLMKRFLSDHVRAAPGLKGKNTGEINAKFILEILIFLSQII